MMQKSEMNVGGVPSQRDDSLTGSLEFGKSINNSKELETIEHNIEVNLYASCISSHGGDSLGLNKTKDFCQDSEVERIINECIVLYMESARPHFGKPEAPFLPLTFSLWREVALKRLRIMIKKN